MSLEFSLLLKLKHQRCIKKEDLRGDDLKHYEAKIEAMNLILISIPNDIYNYVDACTTAKAMWQRFDQFVAEPGEELVSVYNRFAQLMYDLERNGIIFLKVTINTMFLNCLQLEWLKYVTQIRLAKRLTEDSYDDLFDYLQQFKKLVNASRAKKLEKSHYTLTLVAHTGSSSRTITPHYVTHPSSVVDYDDDYQGDAIQNNSEDPLTSAMILLAHAITQRFSNPTNNHLCTYSNTRNQAIVQAGILVMRQKYKTFIRSRGSHGTNVQNDTGNIQRTLRTTSLGTAANVQCYNCSEKEGVILTDEQNDLLFADASQMEEIEELSANICLMARIQPTKSDSVTGPSYDYAFLSEIQTPSTSYVNPLFAKDKQEQKYPKQPKIINNTIGDDQIDSNIIFDEPNEDVNSGSVEYDNNVKESYKLEQLARNEFKEAEKQQIIAKTVQQQNTVLTKQLESYNKKLSAVELKRKTMELQKTQTILKRKMSENEDKYHDNVLDLEARAKKNEDVVLKIGYTNPYTLKKEISQNPKLYDASCLDDSKIQMNVRDSEDILDDATKSQIKMKRKITRSNCY
ncbi:hypothetical protein Tco_0005329 [Tanacetum coccineum]